MDILRGGKSHDLTLVEVQRRIISEIRGCKYDLMLLSPPCDSFTRVKFANPWGPRPLRSMEFPHGFNYLNASEKRTVQLADILVQFSFDAMDAHLESVDSMLILEFPEDLGVVKRGAWAGTRPASIFQSDRLDAILSVAGVTTGAILQSDFGMPYVKPTRLILKLHGEVTRNFYEGIASFDTDGSYLGPAPHFSTGIGLAKTTQSESFKTTGTAAWPEELCEDLVRAANVGFLRNGSMANGLAARVEYSGNETSTKLKNSGKEVGYPIESPPEQFWCGGTGLPRSTCTLGKPAPYFDGCGLTSPGRWPRSQRKFPMDQCWQQIRLKLDAVLGNDETVILKQLAVLACHREELFCKQWVTDTRDIVHEWLGKQAGDYNAADPPVAEEGQPFFLDLVHGILRQARDADFSFYSHLGKGVTLGVEHPLPHVPALYELQTTWRLQDDPTVQASLENANYKSVVDFEKEVLEQFVEEESLGWMGRLDEAAFVEKFRDRYAISSLAVLEEVDKLRILHDASNGTRVNHRIRCRDRQRMPTLKEKRVILNEYRQAKAFAFSLLADASKAHRRIKILESEWGYQACRISGNEIWFNKVGTFGVASASYWWGRAGGGLIRCAYLMNGPDYHFDCLLFADDTEFLAKDRQERRSVLRAVVLLMALGWPFKWAKFRGGHEIEWIGYAVHYREYQVGISAKRAEWLIQWTANLLAAGQVNTSEFRCGLGRIAFVAQALLYEKAMLGILYTWASSVCSAGVVIADIPLAVRLVLHWICQRVKEGGGRLQVVHDYAERSSTREWFRTDARAEDNRAFIGGWELIDSSGAECSTKSARWYACEVLPSEAPWVWSKRGDAQRVIAALELLGTLVAIMLFDPERKRGGSAACAITGGTDNRGNSFIVQKMSSTKFPITPLLIELSEQLRVRNAELHLTWVPRLQNQEADDLSNLKFDGFDQKNRIDCNIGEIKWLVFTELIVTTADMFKSISDEREKRKETKMAVPKLRALRGNKRLKWTDPW